MTLDYMIGRGQQNEATSQLKDALLELKKLESSNNPSPNPNNTPPSKPNQSATPASSAGNATPPNNPTPTNKLESNTQNNPSSASNQSVQNLHTTHADSKIPPPVRKRIQGVGYLICQNKLTKLTKHKKQIHHKIKPAKMKYCKICNTCQAKHKPKP